VALCTFFFSFQYLRRIRFLHLATAVLLCLSTIYCRYHYVADVLAGIVTAAVLVPLGNWLYFKFGPTDREAGTGKQSAPELSPSRAAK
jgi:membrane-associated phospholipid phosphatase